MKFKPDHTMLIYGRSGIGKSHSLKNLDFTRTSFINTEAKPPSIRGMNKLHSYYTPSDMEEFKIAVKASISDDEVDTVIVDSITMLADKIVHKEYIQNAPLNKYGEPNTMAGWQEYKIWFNNFLHVCKTSGKNFIFVALEQEVNEKGKFDAMVLPKIDGSTKFTLCSEFTTVLYADATASDEHPVMKIDEIIASEKTGVKHFFMTSKHMDKFNIEAKSPDGMFDEVFIPNDCKAVIEAIKKYYE